MRTLSLRTPNQIVARNVAKYDRNELKPLLVRRLRTEKTFLVSTDLAESFTDTSIDFCQDDEFIYLTALAIIYAAQKEPLRNDVRPTTIELVINPLSDGYSTLQYGFESTGMEYETRYVPYRNKETQWIHHVKVTKEYELDDGKECPEDTMRYFTFKIRRSDFAAMRHIGVNVCRIQDEEPSCWNPSGGGGFPDFDSFGRLWLKQPHFAIHSLTLDLCGDIFVKLNAIPVDGAALPPKAILFDTFGDKLADLVLTDGFYTASAQSFKLEKAGIYRVKFELGEGDVQDAWIDFTPEGTQHHPQYQGLNDFPDAHLNTYYSKEHFYNEFKLYKERGLERIFWLDYADYRLWLEFIEYRGGIDTEPCKRNIAEYGPDVLPDAVKAAHEAGLEMIVTFKPYDLFQKQGPDEACLRRNLDYLPKVEYPVKKVSLFSQDDAPFGYDIKKIRLLASADNQSYHPVDAVIKESTIQRPDALWFGGRVQVIPEQTRNARRLEFTINNPDKNDKYFSLELPEGGNGFKNRQYRLFELEDANGQVIVPYCVNKNGMDPFHFYQREPENKKGYHEFAPYSGNCWVRLDVGMDQVFGFGKGACIMGMTAEWVEKYAPFKEAAYPEFREFVKHHAQRAIDCGADGFELRLAHHNGCADNLTYMQTEPIAAEFKRRKGRMAEPCLEDFDLLRKIRGEYYTLMLREIREMTQKAGIKFVHHIENTLLVEGTMDNYCQVDFNWRQWISEGLFDEIDLKYITPINAIASNEIIPMARKHGMKVHQTAAVQFTIPSARIRSASWANLTRSTLLDGFALYELWCYLRPGMGEQFARNQSAKNIEVVRKALKS